MKSLATRVKMPSFLRPLAFARAVLAVLPILMLTSPHVHAQYQLTKLLDAAVPIPGGTGTFIGFTDVAYDGRALAMRGWGNNGPEGVYLWKNGALSKVADKSTNVPNSTVPFTTFGEISIDGGHVAFQARSGTSKDGVYTTLGGSLRTVADKTRLVPNSSIPFTNFYLGDVAIMGDEVLFTAIGSNGFGVREGVYRESASGLSRVVDRSTTVVGSNEELTFFHQMDAAGGQVVVKVDGNLYTTLDAPAGQLRAVHQYGTPLPGLANASTSVSPNTLGIDGSDVAFFAVGSNSQEGLYLERSGVVQPIATPETVSPVNGANFSRLLGFYSMSVGEAAFWGESGNLKGVYVSRNGVITNVINSNTMIGGKAVQSFGVSQESLKNGRLVVDVEFKDGTGGIYLAERPLPRTGPGRVTFSTGVDGAINGSTITGNGTSLTVASIAASDVDRRAVIEFNLSTLPAGVRINAVELEITTGNVAADSSLLVFGYEGDAGIRTADFARRDFFLGESPRLTSSSTKSIPLDPAAIQSILAGSVRDIVGLALVGGYEGSQVVFSAMEAGAAARPRLYVNYTAPSPADFNEDGAVDGSDLASWRTGFGPGATSTSLGNADGDGDVDGADFLIWQRELSGAGSSAVATPEPSAAVLMGSIVVAWRRRGCGELRTAK